MNDYTKIIASVVVGMVLYAAATSFFNREKETYTIPAACSNCMFHGDVKISLGTEVIGANCPHCGTKKLTANFWDKKDIEKEKTDKKDDTKK